MQLLHKSKSVAQLSLGSSKNMVFSFGGNQGDLSKVKEKYSDVEDYMQLGGCVVLFKGGWE